MIELGKNIALANFLMKYAERITTADGNTYYRFDGWFQMIPGDYEFVFHRDNWPEDLSQFVTKAGLGGDNIQIEQPEL